MRYTIIIQDKRVSNNNPLTVSYSDWYDYENNWNEHFHFMIINNISHQYTTNGKDWIDIEDDHL